MAIIPERRLFDYTEIEKIGDLQRLLLVINYLPDEEFIQHLEEERGYGRNDYPIRGVWNSILAGIIYENDIYCQLKTGACPQWTTKGFVWTVGGR